MAAVQLVPWDALTANQQHTAAAFVHALSAQAAAKKPGPAEAFYSQERGVESLPYLPVPAITNSQVFLDGPMLLWCCIRGGWNLASYRDGRLMGKLQENLKAALEQLPIASPLGSAGVHKILAIIGRIFDVVLYFPGFSQAVAAREVDPAHPINFDALAMTLRSDLNALDAVAYELLGEQVKLAEAEGNVGSGLRRLENRDWPLFLWKSLERRKKLRSRSLSTAMASIDSSDGAAPPPKKKARAEKPRPGGVSARSAAR